MKDATLKVRGLEVRVPSGLLDRYCEIYGAGSVQEVEEVLGELVPAGSEADAGKVLAWAVSEAEKFSWEEARARLEAMIESGENYDIQK